MSLKKDRDNLRFGFSWGLGFFLAFILFSLVIMPILFCLLGPLLRVF
jgi:hypothetical protein